MKWYRYATPTRRGEWRETSRAAQLDAVRAGFGCVDEYGWGEEPPVIYLHPFVSIERLFEDAARAA